MCITVLPVICLQLKKSSRHWYQEKQSGSNAHVSGGQAVNSIENQPPVKIEKIGDLTPVQDFEAMMSQRDNPEWVEKAIKELREKILALLIHSDEGDNYHKAVECVAALRKGCIIEQVCLSSSLYSMHDVHMCMLSKIVNLLFPRYLLMIAVLLLDCIVIFLVCNEKYI